MKKHKILIIEDEVAYIKILGEKLTKENFDVITAQNGEEGLMLALREHPDLMLLDIMMPQMNGIEVLKKIRKDEWGKNAKIIFLTNVSDEKYIAEAISEQTFDYFIKTDSPIEDIMIKIKEKLA